MDEICSFCSKPRVEVKKLIQGDDNVFICDECVELCVTVLHNIKLKELASSFEKSNILMFGPTRSDKTI